MRDLTPDQVAATAAAAGLPMTPEERLDGRLRAYIIVCGEHGADPRPTTAAR